MSGWDDTNSELAEMLGSAALIQEAVPGFLPRTIYARAGTHWTMLSVRNVVRVDVVLCVAGILANVPTTSELMEYLADKSVSLIAGDYLPVIPADRAYCGVAFKATLAPYEALLGPSVPAKLYMQSIISAAIGCAEEMEAELQHQFGGVAWDFDHRGYFLNF